MEQQGEENKENNVSDYSRKVWIAAAIFSFVVIVLLFIKATFGVFLLVLAGALIALFLTGLTSLIKRKTNWTEPLSKVVAVFGILILVGGLVWLIEAKVQNQISELTQTLPQSLAQAKAQLSKSALGKTVVEKMSTTQAEQKAKDLVGKLFQTTFGVFGDLYVVLFLGIFFTVSPKLYTEGLVHLIPKRGQKKGSEVLHQIGSTLQKWLKGKFFAMFVVFVLTAVSLLIIGLPMWLVLALIAGLLNFIPNFGPLIAMIPAVGVALLQGPGTAALVAGLYMVIQVLESNFITPSVQKKLINIPPALIIMAQLFIAPLTGGWGLVLATPLMVILIVVVKELYLKKNK